MPLDDVSYGPTSPILSPDRPGNDPTTRTPTGQPVTSRPAEHGVIRQDNPSGDPYGNVVTDAGGNVVAPAPTKGASSSLPLGVYFLGAVAVVGLADTVAAPLVITFLAAATFYNANTLLTRLTKKG